MVPNNKDTIRDRQLRGDSKDANVKGNVLVCVGEESPEEQALRRPQIKMVRTTKRLIWPDHVEEIRKEVMFICFGYGNG